MRRGFGIHAALAAAVLGDMGRRIGSDEVVIDLSPRDLPRAIPPQRVTIAAPFQPYVPGEKERRRRQKQIARGQLRAENGLQKS